MCENGTCSIRYFGGRAGRQGHEMSMSHLIRRIITDHPADLLLILIWLAALLIWMATMLVISRPLWRLAGA